MSRPEPPESQNEWQSWVAKDESPDTYMHGNFETEKFWEWCEVRQFARASFLSRLHTGIGVNRGIANGTSQQIKTTWWTFCWSSKMESFKERITLLRCSDANPRHAFGLLERVCTILKKHEAFSTNHTGTCIHQGRQEMLLFYCLFKPISGRTKKCIGQGKIQ